MTVSVATLALLAILVLLWLLFGSPTNESASSLDALQIERLLPSNCHHFPQITQMLKEEDRQFMRMRAQHHVERKWNAERRRILKQYLRGLGQDFVRVQRLARLVSALSPEIRKGQELEWMWLGLQFHVSYRMVELKLAFGSLSPEGLAELTGIITGVAEELEHRMSLIAESSPSRLRVNLGS